MNKKKPTYEELEARLNQAEESLGAIRSGEIDVVVGEKCPFIVRAKEAEDSLRESQETLELAISGSNAGLWDLKFNPEDPYKIPDEIYISPWLKGFIGLSEDEFPNSISAWHSRIHPEDLELLKKVAQEHLEGRRDIHDVEYRIYHKDGSIRWIHSRGKIQRDENGVPKRWNGIDWDITKRKQTEGELRESEERYRLLVENAGDVIAIVQDGYFRFINQKATELLGYSLEELMPRPFWEIIHPEDREKVLESYSKRLRGEETPAVYSFRAVDKEGNVKWAEMNAVNIFHEGKPAVLCFVRDMTERKRIEAEMVSLQEQLRQAQKMEAIGRLAGGIAHDFNNLLTVIKGNTQLSLMDLREGDPLKKNLEEIKSASDRAADLTRQLLAFSRKQIMEMRVIDLNTIIKNLEKMVRRIIGEDIELVTFLTEGIGRVRADPGQMEQAIINIVVNARDAMPDGGKLTIETANVELDEEYARNHVAVKTGRYVMLSISDTGVGMTSEVRERVFEPFFTTKEMGKGTGLGLSTVYGIVKQSEGNIWVYSEPGQGTTFKIYLPRVDEPLEELREEVIGEVPRGTETVLVVEDEETVRKLAVRVLKREGYKILEAPDGGKAFMLCEGFKEPIHLILTDVVMPGMSGSKLVERLKEIHPEMKVLYMSGYTDNAIVHHGVLEEGTNFIQKPFALDGLARKVREVLDK